MNSSVYDRYFSTHFGSIHDPRDFFFSHRYFQANFSSFLPSDKESRVLDIGCGTGHFLHYIDGLGYNNYFGIDISKEQIAYCKDHVTTSVLLVRDTQKFLKEHKDTFDFILMNDVIEHLPKDDIIPILSHAYHALRKKGKIVIKTVNLKNRWGMAVRYMDFTHTVGFTDESLRQVMRLAGFTSIVIYKEIHPIHDIKSFVRVILKSIVEAWYFVEYVLSFSSLRAILTNMIIAVGVKE